MEYTFNSLLAPMAEPPRRMRQFSASLMVHLAALTALALIPITHPQMLQKPASTYLVMPILSEYQAPKHAPVAPKVKLPAVPRVETPQIAKLEIPRIRPRVDDTVAPPKVTPAKFDPVIAAPVPVTPRLREVKTGVLGEGSSAKPTVKAAVQKVQTGGFGDENGVNGEGQKNARVLIAHLGSPDLPFGGGYGNGSGGAHGARGAVSSAGFGSGVATPVAGGQGQGNGGVRAGGFGDATAVASQSRSRALSAGGDVTPVEILSKPRPQYTEEARQLKIEGEVLLDVIFAANGSLHVQRVVRGLGHGLDEAAIRAAQQIRFRPARRDGQSFDSTAVLHIVFEMAY